ncbi:MAG: GxxExxY protein [Methanosarcinales archaeon]
MHADNPDLKYTELTEEIIRIFYRVYNKRGYGFLEKVYDNTIQSIFALNRKLNVRHFIFCVNPYNLRHK